MIFIRYLLFTLLAALGPVFGQVVALYVKEELMSGRFYIDLIQKLILLALAIVVIVSNLGAFTELVIILSVIIFYFLRSEFIYLSLGVLFFLCSFNLNAIGGVFLLIFLFLLLAGLKKQSVGQSAKSSILYLATSLFLFGLWAWIY